MFVTSTSEANRENKISLQQWAFNYIYTIYCNVAPLGLAVKHFTIVIDTRDLYVDVFVTSSLEANREKHISLLQWIANDTNKMYGNLDPLELYSKTFYNGNFRTVSWCVRQLALR